MRKKKQKLILFFNIKSNRMKNPKIINVIIYDGQPFHVNYPLPKGEGASRVNTPTNVGSSP